MAKRKPVKQARKTREQPSIHVTFDDANANRHDERSLAAVQASVETLGAGRSIVADRTGKVIGGEATLKAAQALGLKFRPVHTSGDEMVVVVRDDLGPEDPKRTALAIADNRTARLSDFDYGILANQMQTLDAQTPYLLPSTGFSPDEIGLLAGGAVPQPGGDAESGGSAGGGAGDGGPEMGKPIKLTAEQRAVVDRVIERVRADEGSDLSEGRVIELVCGDFLSGA